MNPIRELTNAIADGIRLVMMGVGLILALVVAAIVIGVVIHL